MKKVIFVFCALALFLFACKNKQEDVGVVKMIMIQGFMSDSIKVTATTPLSQTESVFFHDVSWRAVLDSLEQVGKKDHVHLYHMRISSSRIGDGKYFDYYDSSKAAFHNLKLGDAVNYVTGELYRK